MRTSILAKIGSSCVKKGLAVREKKEEHGKLEDLSFLTLLLMQKLKVLRKNYFSEANQCYAAVMFSEQTLVAV